MGDEGMGGDVGQGGHTRGVGEGQGGRSQAEKGGKREEK